MELIEKKIGFILGSRLGVVCTALQCMSFDASTEQVWHYWSGGFQETHRSSGHTEGWALMEENNVWWQQHDHNITTTTTSSRTNTLIRQASSSRQATLHLGCLLSGLPMKVMGKFSPKLILHKNSLMETTYPEMCLSWFYILSSWKSKLTIPES